MFIIVERDWLMTLRGTVYRYDKTSACKRMKQNNDGKCLFLITQWKTNVKINDNIFFEGGLFPLKKIDRLRCFVVINSFSSCIQKR